MLRAFFVPQNASQFDEFGMKNECSPSVFFGRHVGAKTRGKGFSVGGF
jgi:hypothetical protein